MKVVFIKQTALDVEDTGDVTDKKAHAMAGFSTTVIAISSVITFLEYLPNFLRYISGYYIITILYYTMCLLVFKTINVQCCRYVGIDR